MNLKIATLRVKLTRRLLRVGRKVDEIVWRQHDKALLALRTAAYIDAHNAKQAAELARRSAEEAQRTADHRLEQAGTIDTAVAAEAHTAARVEFKA